MPQPALDAKFLHGFFIHFAGIVLVVVAPQFFGRIHGDVGSLEQIIAIDPVRRKQGNTDTGTDIEFLLSDDE